MVAIDQFIVVQHQQHATAIQHPNTQAATTVLFLLAAINSYRVNEGERVPIRVIHVGFCCVEAFDPGTAPFSRRRHSG